MEEIKYYEPCFSKEDYKRLFDITKLSEKEIVLNFINKAYSIKHYIYNDEDLKTLVNQLKNIFPKFNQPIEFDCLNEELKWHLIKVHIFSKFKNIKLIEDEQDNLQRLQKGYSLLKNKGLLENKIILEDKNKLATCV